ncbi:MAG: hypothetical protein KGZ39_08590 [Simkania sp.]|nr:hypothetical protein [Simkania sp.]
MPLNNIPINPGDEKLLTTPFGKMFANMPGAKNQDQDTLIREVKASMNIYSQNCVQQMQQDQARAQKVAQMMKQVAEGGSPDES